MSLLLGSWEGAQGLGSLLAWGCPDHFEIIRLGLWARRCPGGAAQCLWAAAGNFPVNVGVLMASRVLQGHCHPPGVTLVRAGALSPIMSGVKWGGATSPATHWVPVCCRGGACRGQGVSLPPGEHSWGGSAGAGSHFPSAQRQPGLNHCW